MKNIFSRFTDKLKHIKISTFMIMCVITVIFIVLPLVMKIPFVSNFIAWIMSALRYQEYKSAYLGIIGGIIGSWLAITGAIHTQEKENSRKEEKEKEEKRIAKEENKKFAKNICKNFLLSEMKRNDLRLRLGNSPNKLLELLISNPNGNFGPEYKVSVSNWKEIRKELISIDPECADVMFSVYKYFEPLTIFQGKIHELKAEYGIDYSLYESDYKKAINYIEKG